LREIENRLDGTYERHRQIRLAEARPVSEMIKNATQKLEDLPSESQKNGLVIDLKQLATLTSNYLDVTSTVPLRNISSFVELSENLYNRDFEGPFEQNLFLKKFNEAYPDAPLNQNRREYLLILVGMSQVFYRNEGLENRPNGEFYTDFETPNVPKLNRDLKLWDIEIVTDPIKGLSLRKGDTVLTMQDNPIEIMTLLKEKMEL
jgi:hypothetical protein